MNIEEPQLQAAQAFEEVLFYLLVRKMQQVNGRVCPGDVRQQNLAFRASSLRQALMLARNCKTAMRTTIDVIRDDLPIGGGLLNSCFDGRHRGFKHAFVVCQVGN